MALSLKLASRFILPAIAVGLIGFAVVTVSKPNNSQAAPPAAPASASSKMANVVAALGVVEPSSEVIAVASELPGVIRTVFVTPGQMVAKGDALFALDARENDSHRATALADLAAARAAAQARRAAVATAQSAVDDNRARLALFANVSDQRAVSTDERDRARFAAQRAEAQLAEARAGLVQADAAIAQSQARLGEINIEAARLTMRAPIDATVLRVTARPGEFATAGPLTTPLIALGQLSPLHVRLQIDEEDVGRVREGSTAEGALRGAGDKKVPLTFIRFEPQARPKQNLNGGSERVDTRVVEAIYALDPNALRAFVGQQMDVFITATPMPAVAPTREKAR